MTLAGVNDFLVVQGAKNLLIRKAGHPKCLFMGSTAGRKFSYYGTLVYMAIFVAFYSKTSHNKMDRPFFGIGNKHITRMQAP